MRRCLWVLGQGSEAQTLSGVCASCALKGGDAGSALNVSPSLALGAAVCWASLGRLRRCELPECQQATTARLFPDG